MDQTPTPISYPRITVPGRGEFEVKFGLAAARIMDQRLGLDGLAIIAKLRESISKDKDGKPTTVRDKVASPGRIAPDFILTLLSACIWKQAHMTAEDLADAFDSDGDDVSALPGITLILLEAVSKTKWAAHLELRAPSTAAATPQQPLN